MKELAKVSARSPLIHKNTFRSNYIFTMIFFGALGVGDFAQKITL